MVLKSNGTALLYIEETINIRTPAIIGRSYTETKRATQILGYATEKKVESTVSGD